MECIKTTYLSKHDINVPCGKCAFCLATRRSDWSSRLHYERKKHVESSFVTLTYADAHLIFRNGLSQLSTPKKDANGKQIEGSHLQNFFKLVRKAGVKMRYYAVGEYGSRTYRPHYHILFFGHVPEDVIRKSWDKGLVHIGRVTDASVSYCLKYMVNSRATGMRNGRTHPFVVMSRRPGLGSNYLTAAMIEWHKSERKNYLILDGKKLHLPRYYKGKIFSKIDHVRIAVRDQRAAEQVLIKKFRKMPKAWSAQRCWDYHMQQRHLAAKRIRDKSSQHLTI